MGASGFGAFPSPLGNGNQGVDAIEPASSKCSLNTCIEFFESDTPTKKEERAKALSSFLVGV